MTLIIARKTITAVSGAGTILGQGGGARPKAPKSGTRNRVPR